MPLDPVLIEQVLTTAESRDVTESPIVTAVILADPANAADLVPFLEHHGSIQSRNARRILCLFGPAGAPHLVNALGASAVNGRKEGIEIFWTMLFGEDAWSVREALGRSAESVHLLLDDKRPLPNFMPNYVERDFQGRICDLMFVLLQLLLDPHYDQSSFRSFDDTDRDQEIARLKRRGLGLNIA